jgi:DNA-binding response OmpR family regulator
MTDIKKNILIIDDDADFLFSVKVVLESGGYKVVDASSAEEGLKKYKEATPDLIIVDLMMEEVDSGANFVKEVKALGGNVPIFLLSSVGDQMNQAVNYNDLGFAGVLQKPIEPKTLLATVKAKL